MFLLLYFSIIGSNSLNFPSSSSLGHKCTFPVPSHNIHVSNLSGSLHALVCFIVPCLQSNSLYRYAVVLYENPHVVYLSNYVHVLIRTSASMFHYSIPRYILRLLSGMALSYALESQTVLFQRV